MTTIVTDAHDPFSQTPDQGRGYHITQATLNDGVVNYTYEITEGDAAGDVHSVKGSKIATDDLLNAFAALGPHLASIDDVFKHAGVQVGDFEELRGHELGFLYNITGFKIIGSGEAESAVVSGTKYVNSAGGRISLTTPKIPLDHMSSYLWYRELKSAMDMIREEVCQYKEGKFQYGSDEEEEEVKPKRGRKNKNQLSINVMMDSDESEAAEEESDGGEAESGMDDEFENARI